MKQAFVLAAITLALAASPAAAAERLPAKLVGNWCSVDPPKSEGEWIYNRTTQCPLGTLTRWKIRTDGIDGQDGTDGPSGKCQLLQMIVIKSDDYLAKFRCDIEGNISNAVYRLTLKGNQLVTSVVDRKAEETTQADHANDPAPSVDKRCVVVDPTSTPLNVRTSPNGRIVGTIANGVFASILDRSADRRGRSWVYIGEYSSGKPVGWVFREFISCL